MSQPKPHTFIHPLLGPLTGLSGLPHTPNTTQFRSVPFASIPSRFKQSVLLDHIPSSSGSRNLTQYGPACPAPAQDNQTAAAGGLLPGEEENEFDEINCLNLTISAPTESLCGKDGTEGLAVMVYVHGGAFAEGAGHISVLHDTTHLVELSIKECHPVIIVSIHYRLHFLGFLACSDLYHEAHTLNTPRCNFGLHDQRNAFLWIKRFISGFGGSPNNITAFGESAGSGSIAMHMCSNVPLFNRAILLSGTTAACPPVAMKYKEAEYLELLRYCSIDEEDPDRLNKLRDVPVELLVDAIKGVGIPLFRSYRDEGFWPDGFPGYFTEGKLIAGCEWVDEIIIGDSFFEGSFLMNTMRSVPRDAFIALSHEALGPSNAEQILSAYDITPSTDPNPFWTRISYLMGDVMFSSPTHNLAKSLITNLGNKKKIYRYTQTVRNPFPGSPVYQVAGPHSIDSFFLFGTLRERYPTKKLRDLSEEFGKRWLRFAAGIEPWAQYETKEEKIMVINGITGFDLRSQEDDTIDSAASEEGVRRYEGWEAIADVMQKLAEGDHGRENGEKARMEWGTDGGVFRLAGLQGPYGVVLP
ncbi:alpha/beta-hydrolase [Cadophora sp. DSE1049]|nr:alpha/beta-hydrolase [Cadophora sp. DSE1049]